MTREEIQTEFDRFFEFDTEDRSFVTSTSCRIIAEMAVEASSSRRRENDHPYLYGGTRYKVGNHNGLPCVLGIPFDLEGHWVALVLADNDCHMTHPPRSSVRLSDEELDFIGVDYGEFFNRRFVRTIETAVLRKNGLSGEKA